MQPVGSTIEVMWLAPVRGIFVDVRERYSQEQGNERDLSPIPLEDGVEWHLSPTDQQRSLLEKWFDFYKDAHAKDEAASLAGAATVVAGEPLPVDDQFPPFVACFIVAASMHLNSHVRSRLLRFEEVGGELLPHSGYPMLEATRLTTWRAQEPVTVETALDIAATYRVVRRCVDRSEEHASRRAVVAYRAAVGSRFLDTIPVLLCASLEALAGSYKERRVISALIPEYLTTMQEDEGRRRLKRLYKLRHWFAHSAAIREMQSRSNRETALEEGYALAKEVIRTALATHD